MTDDSLQGHEVRREEENVGKNVWWWRSLGGEEKESELEEMDSIGGREQNRAFAATGQEIDLT